jgi:diguanylate cyclase (GGDEF)-like protein
MSRYHDMQATGAPSVAPQGDLGAGCDDESGLGALCEALCDHLGAAVVGAWRLSDGQRQLSLCGVWPDGAVGPLPGPGCVPLVPPGRPGDLQVHAVADGGGWCLSLLGDRVLGALMVDTDRPVPSQLTAKTVLLVSRVTALISREQDVRRQGFDERLDDGVAEIFAEAAEHEETDAALLRLHHKLTRGTEDLAVSVFLLIDGRLTPVATHPVDQRGRDPGTETACTEVHRSLAETVAASGRVSVANPDAGSAATPARSVEYMVLGIPLNRRGGVFGVLVVDVPRAHRFDAEDTRLAVETAELVAAVVDRVRLKADAQQRLTVASAQLELLQAGVHSCSLLEAAEAVARTIAKVLGVPCAATYLVDRSKVITELAAVGVTDEMVATLRRGLIGQRGPDSPLWQYAVDCPQPGPYFVDDVRAGAVRPGGVAALLGFRCLAAIPLLSSDGPLGLVMCGDSRGPRRWRSSERALMAQLALQGTIVVDNARLREIERHQATHDSLTGLMNRTCFQDHLRRELARSGRSGDPVTVLIADLDRFKEINDTFGHHQGDALLVEVAQRLAAAVRETDEVARLGGDEFGILLPATDADGGRVIEARIEEALAAPVCLESTLAQVGASIGIASFPDHGQTENDLIRLADVAMYVAKRSGQRYSVYEYQTDLHHPGESSHLGDLARALIGDELVLHFQPKVETRTDHVVGVEALVRWQHPQRGLLDPDSFIPLAERAGLVRRVTNWVLPQALRQCQQWLSDGLDLSIAVNVSAQDLADPSFLERVNAELSNSGVPTDHLIIELTETALLADLAKGMRTLVALRELGVRISLDDFGTGYSALSYLSSLPIDELKIDQSFFVNGLDGRAGTVAQSMIELSHRLGLTVVAEGVETPTLCRQLRQLGCDQIQGFVHTPPLPPESLAAWVTRARRPIRTSSTAAWR